MAGVDACMSPPFALVSVFIFMFLLIFSLLHVVFVRSSSSCLCSSRCCCRRLPLCPSPCCCFGPCSCLCVGPCSCACLCPCLVCLSCSSSCLCSSVRSVLPQQFCIIGLSFVASGGGLSGGTCHPRSLSILGGVAGCYRTSSFSTRALALARGLLGLGYGLSVVGGCGFLFVMLASSTPSSSADVEACFRILNLHPWDFQSHQHIGCWIYKLVVRLDSVNCNIFKLAGLIDCLHARAWIVGGPSLVRGSLGGGVGQRKSRPLALRSQRPEQQPRDHHPQNSTDLPLSPGEVKPEVCTRSARTLVGCPALSTERWTLQGTLAGGPVLPSVRGALQGERGIVQPWLESRRLGGQHLSSSWGPKLATGIEEESRVLVPSRQHVLGKWLGWSCSLTFSLIFRLNILEGWFSAIASAA